MNDLIGRQEAIDAINAFPEGNWSKKRYIRAINELPRAEPERDTPMKPNETTDNTWGVPTRQAVCAKCGHYLAPNIAALVIGEYSGKRITYCETCGQAIDWEGWN